MRGSILRLLSLALCACAPASEHERIERRCEAALATYTREASPKVLMEDLDWRCAEALGDAINLDWEASGVDPQALEESETASMLLSGVLAIVGGPQLTVGEVLEDPDLPRVAGDELALLADVYELNEEDSAGELWLTFTRASIKRTLIVELTAEDPVLFFGQYSPDTETASFSQLMTMFGEFEVQSMTSLAGEVIIHEATHKLVPYHIPCTNGLTSGCDETPEGAYGVGIWWWNNWLTVEPAFLQTTACDQSEGRLQGACQGHIVEYKDWSPCDWVCAE